MQSMIKGETGSNMEFFGGVLSINIPEICHSFYIYDWLFNRLYTKFFSMN